MRSFPSLPARSRHQSGSEQQPFCALRRAAPRCAVLCCAVQAPLELLLGPGWSNTCLSEPGAAPHCSLPQLLGFCKLLSFQLVPDPTPASAAATAPVSYSYSFAYGPFAGWACVSLLSTSGAVADLVLWALLRLQYKLFNSQVYAKVRGRHHRV